MSYVLPDAVRSVLVRDTDKTTGSAASLTDATIQAAIDDAEAQVDGTLRLLYEVPFDPAPDLVVTITRDIAAYLADLTYRQSQDYSSALDPVYLRYQRALQNLQGIATDVITLDAPRSDADGDEPDIGQATVVNVYRGALFSMGEFLAPRGRWP